MKNKQIVLRIEEELYDTLKRYADNKDVSVAYIVREALKKYVEKQEKLKRVRQQIKERIEEGRLDPNKPISIDMKSFLLGDFDLEE